VEGFCDVNESIKDLHVAGTVDLGPLVRLQKRAWRGAFFTGLGIYLEVMLAFVLATEQGLSWASATIVVAIAIAQLILVVHPAHLLVRRQLVRRYRIYLALMAACVVVLSIGSPAGDARAVAAILAALVAALTAWAAIGLIRTARDLDPRLRNLQDGSVLLESLSFKPSDFLATRLRALGGERSRWIVLAIVAVTTFIVVLGTLSSLLQMMGWRPASPVGQIATIVAMLVFYIGLRRLKLSASQLRDRDRRAPVLILRQFGDDFLESGKVSLGAAPTFEHFVAGELNRIGPVIAIGRPGERLQPLGASRDYLTHPDWQSAVTTTILDAALVVFVLGDSENLLWEFRRTIETHGKRRTLIVVPPLRDRHEIARRWSGFVQASADLLGAGFPGELPNHSVLAIAFAGDDAVMMVNDERPRAGAIVVRSRSDYRLVFRLFGRLLREDITSSGGLKAFLEKTMPIVTTDHAHFANTTQRGGEAQRNL
jgi:hypothetical protein